MLFNSYPFLLIFLPIALLGTYLLQTKANKKYRLAWLVLCSVFFYAWWEVSYLLFLFSSIIVNYYIAQKTITKSSRLSPVNWLRLGIVFNLSLLAYFKYANFFVDILKYANLIDTDFNKITLPLAISFVTFQQIAFLVERLRNPNVSFTFLQYTFFITFFPQLIAGPIVYFTKVLPQYAKKICLTITPKSLSIGLSYLCFGLFKKVIIADSFEPYSQAVFSAASIGTQLSLIEAWGGALCYTFQLYFDFSGYSDMAIGLAKMFNLELPINFDSPYKSKSIIEFWRRWHITLSDFLKSYLYIPLGGNRNGTVRKQVNLLLTMALGGLWHGAGVTFILWGCLHGAALIINHAWRNIISGLSISEITTSFIYKRVAQLLTFIFVIYAWVFFRADNMQSALLIVKAMSNIHNVLLPENYHAFLQSIGFSQEWLPGQIGKMPYFKGLRECFILMCGFILVWTMPNTQSIFMRNDTLKKSTVIIWTPTVLWSAFLAMMTICILLTINKMSTFLYYQF